MMQDFAPCIIYRIKNVLLKKGKPMKTLKRLFQLLPICMVALGFYACDEIGLDDILPGKEKDEFIIWDFSPINLHFSVTGEDGEDLLNPTTPGSYAGLSASATYEEKTYEKDVFEDNNVAPGRALVPIHLSVAMH